MPPEICNFTFKIMNSIESQKGEIVMYQPDETIRLEVRVENETVWLNRQQIAALFSRDIKTIGKHINNALHEELDGESVGAKFATTAADGKTYQVEYYNLDMIMSVGYRVISFGSFTKSSYLCPRNHIINIKSTLLWTNYKTFKTTFTSFAANV